MHKFLQPGIVRAKSAWHTQKCWGNQVVMAGSRARQTTRFCDVLWVTNRPNKQRTCVEADALHMCELDYTYISRSMRVHLIFRSVG